MLSYFSSKTPAPKKDNPVADEKLIHYEDYLELANRLEQAKDRIQELETTLEAKEQLHNELHQKLHLLTTSIEQEKSIFQEQRLQFTQEEDTLTNEIASLKVDLLKQEAHYENLRKKTVELQIEQEAQLELQQQHKILQEKMDAKEREYEMLVKKIAELESAKQQAEEHLIKEKNEHKETKSALEIEKKARQPKPQHINEKKETPALLPRVVNNNTTLFNSNNQKSFLRKPIYPEPWEYYAGF